MVSRPFDVRAFLSAVAFCAMVAGGPAPACAQEKIAKLTEENITAFILRTTDITNGTQGLSPDEIEDYLDRHIEDGARFKSTMKYSIPGYPAQESSMSLEKRDFIDSVRKGAESVANYENEIRVESVKISGKGDKATVATTGTEHGMMPMSVDGVTTQLVPVDGSSSCTQIITLEKGIIQMYGAQCVTVINFTPD